MRPKIHPMASDWAMGIFAEADAVGAWPSLDVKDVVARRAQIDLIKNDRELETCAIDELRFVVLRAIAEGWPSANAPEDLAKAVLAGE